RFAYLPRKLAHFRWLTSNKTATGGWKRLDEIGMVMQRQGRGIPAFVRLERVNLHAWEAINSLSRGHVLGAAAGFTRAAGTSLCSGRLLKSLLSPHTWRVIWVGQVLRRRAVKEGRCEVPAPVAGHAVDDCSSVVQQV
ncbi:MAG: hypothetical protein ACRDHE_16465, partial [Ktedonobacterales bacterium]